MTAEENPRGTVSIEVSSRETEVDPQLSACAIDSGQDGPPLHEIPDTSAAEERRGASGRAQAELSSSTMRLVAGELVGGRYRIERELGEGGHGGGVSGGR